MQSVAALADVEDGIWRVSLEDSVTGTQRNVTARMVVNAAGAWADEVAKDPGTVVLDVSDITSSWARWALSITDHIVFVATMTGYITLFPI